MEHLERKQKLKHRLLVLCIVSVAMLSSGCEAWVSVRITSHYPFPVEVYDATHSTLNYPPHLLGVVAPGATLQTQIIADGGIGFYRFTISRVHGKGIKKITASGPMINDKGTLIIGE